MGFGQRPCAASAGSALSLPKASAKQRPCRLGSGLALSVIASRCHLSQSERPWQSAKFPVLHFTPCCRKGSRRRCAETFRLCQGLPLWGSWTPLGGLRGQGCWQEAAHLVWPCLAEAQPHRKHDLNLGPAPPLPGLPSPSSLRDATFPKVRGLGSPRSFPVYTSRPAAARGAEGAALRLSAYAKGSPFGGAGAKRLRGRGCWRGDFAPV